MICVVVDLDYEVEFVMDVMMILDIVVFGVFVVVLGVDIMCCIESVFVVCGFVMVMIMCVWVGVVIVV